MSDNNPAVQTVKITVEAGASPSFYFGCTFVGSQDGGGWGKPKKTNKSESKAELKAEREDDDDEDVELHTSPLPDQRGEPQEQAELPLDIQETAEEFNNLDQEILTLLVAVDDHVNIPDKFNLSNCNQEQKVELKTLLQKTFHRDDDDYEPLGALEDKLEELTSS